MSRTTLLWLLWAGLTVPAAVVVGAVILAGGDRGFLLMGRATDAHHQIVRACDVCHVEPFGGKAALQKACVGCHGAELKAAKDSHPLSKFIDPRNAPLLARLDARLCVTCHQEHRPGRTRAMAVTLPDDFCVTCHADIGTERPSHKGLAFTTCASAGCHNYHDNRALYAEFLRAHAYEQARLSVQRVPLPEPNGAKAVGPALTPAEADAPPQPAGSPQIRAIWAADAHARAGVNCSGCHTTKAAPRIWIARPGPETCETCHADQARTFAEGRHGMRLREGMAAARGGLFDPFTRGPLPPMTPAEARLPMKAEAGHRQLVCTACHGAHDFDTVRAKAAACLGCHDDAHSRAYRDSPHHRLFLVEKAGKIPAGSGVSCATCHMPRVESRAPDGTPRFFTNHNQSATLRPNEKMIRPVCGHCHGLPFTLNALADRDLIRRNFSGWPAAHVPSPGWVLRKQAAGDRDEQ